MYLLHLSSCKLLILLFLIDSVYSNPLMVKTFLHPQKVKNKLPRRQLITQFQNGQYFQDIFSEYPSPSEIIFGHACENPEEWEQRFERKNINDGIYQGKVRWGNKDGHYEEHYWDLNHG